MVSSGAPARRPTLTPSGYAKRQQQRARRSGLSRASTSAASLRNPCILASLSKGSAAGPNSSASSPAPLLRRRSIWKKRSCA